MKKITINFICLTLITLTCQLLWAQKDSLLIKALKDQSLIVTDDMYPAMLESITPEAARIFFDMKAEELGSELTKRSGSNSDKKLKLSPSNLALLIYLTVENNEMDSGVYQIQDVFLDLIPWDVPTKDKVKFLKEISLAFLMAEENLK